MAFLQVDFFSETFGMSMNMNVILPQEIQVPNPVNGGAVPQALPGDVLASRLERRPYGVGASHFH